jgi:hypothetical protein
MLKIRSNTRLFLYDVVKDIETGITRDGLVALELLLLMAPLLDPPCLRNRST